MGLGALLALYAGTVLVACASYRKLLYPAPNAGPLVIPEGAELFALRAADGVPVHALYFPAPEGRPTVVHFHGNGETIGDGAWLSTPLRARGFGVLLVEYRGYGVSRGEPPIVPSEDGLYRDAAAALDALERRGVSFDRTVLWGTSLGTGVAAEMALRGRGSAVVLAAPYTSIRALASRYAPFLPIPLIVQERFDTLEKAPKIRVRVLVVHGSEDEVIPVAMGKKVASALPHGTLVVVRGGHHNDLFAVDPSLFEAMARFIEG